MEQTRPVSAIEFGTVIDHIPVGAPLRIIELLGLPVGEYQITVGLNLPSSRHEKKGLIKIAGKHLTKKEITHVAIFAPNATISLIRNFAVAEKIQAELPEHVTGIFQCPNPRCITNHEPMNTQFRISTFKQDILGTCEYCEKRFFREELAI